MTNQPDSRSLSSHSGSWRDALRQINPRSFLTGIIPLFVFAHLGHHAVGAMLQPLMPMIRTELGLTYTSVGFLMSAFTLTNGLSQLPAGLVADRFGTRMMVLLGVTGVAVAGFLIGFANSYVTLMILLIVSALLGGGYHPASIAAISSNVSANIRGRALGIHAIGGTSSMWLLPVLVTPIVSVWNWRMAFRIVSIPIAVLGIALYVLIGKEVKAIARRREGIPDEQGRDELNRINWGLMIPFMALSILAGTVIMSTMGYLSFYATDVLNMPESKVPLLVAVPSLTGLFAAPLGGYLSDRFGSVKVMVSIGFGAIPFVYLLGMAPNVIVLGTLMLVIGILMSIRMPTSESYIAGHTPQKRRSTMLGIYFFAGTGVAGPMMPLIGNLIDKKGFHWTFSLAGAVIAGVVVICSFFLWKNQQDKKST